MRVSDSPNQEAWLFTLAEEKLSTFANRIDQELPDLAVLAKSNAIFSDFSSTGEGKKVAPTSTEEKYQQVIKLIGELSLFEESNTPKHQNGKSSTPNFLETFGGFRKKVIEAFISI